MFKCVIGLAICIVLLLVFPKVIIFFEKRINEIAGWKTDTLIFSYLFFLLIDAGIIGYFIYEIFQYF